MNAQDFELRKQELLSQEATQPERLLWLSFAGEDGFRGVVITKARGLLNALIKTKQLGINPGGEVKSYVVPEAEMPPGALDHLLSKTELRAYGLVQ